MPFGLAKQHSSCSQLPALIWQWPAAQSAVVGRLCCAPPHCAPSAPKQYSVLTGMRGSVDGASFLVGRWTLPNCRLVGSGGWAVSIRGLPGKPAPTGAPHVFIVGATGSRTVTDSCAADPI